MGTLPLNGAPPRGGAVKGEGHAYSQRLRKESSIRRGEGGKGSWKEKAVNGRGRHERASAINEEEDDGGIRGWRVARERGGRRQTAGFSQLSGQSEGTISKPSVAEAKFFHNMPFQIQI